MSPFLIMIESNTKFYISMDLDGMATYLALLFEDENFKMEELISPVLIGISKGNKKYLDSKREVDYIPYISYFAKREVLKYKSLK